MKTWEIIEKRWGSRCVSIKHLTIGSGRASDAGGVRLLK